MKKLIEYIKELRKKPYGNAVLFFGFYIIFFTIISIMARTGSVGNVGQDNEPTGVVVNNLEKYNYSFEYKVVLDNDTYSYTGNKEYNTIYYKYNGKDYYNRDDKSYIKEDNWKEVDNPIKFYSFLKETNMNNIINSSYIDSKNNYDNGEVAYNLLVSSNTLNKMINGVETDYDEIPNKIKVSVNNGYISEINYNLDNYCKEKDSCKSLNIIVNYKEFNKIS